MLLKPDKISVDMVDIIINISPYDFSEQLQPLLNVKIFDDELVYKVKTSDRDWKSYRHNFYYTSKDESYSFFFAYQSNLENIKNRFYFSYNPEKVDSGDEMLITIMTFILANIRTAQITKFDIAFDYEGIRTTDLIIDKSSYREHHTRRYSDSDPTEYIGKDSITIYDKASEEAKEDLNKKQGNKTRIEYRIKDKIPFLDYESYKCTTTMGSFNLRGVLGLYDDKELTPKEKFLVYSIENGYPMDKISWKDKKRYQEISEKKKEVYTEIRPSQLDIEKAIKKYLFDLFIDYNLTV